MTPVRLKKAKALRHMFFSLLLLGNMNLRATIDSNEQQLLLSRVMTEKQIEKLPPRSSEPPINIPASCQYSCEISCNNKDN